MYKIFANNYVDTIGQYGRGNIDLNNRQVVHNPDGSISTELSFTVGFDDDVVLLPSIVNGVVLDEEDAIQHYLDTGEYLGIFQTVDEAEEYAINLHNRQEWYYTGYNEDTITIYDPSEEAYPVLNPKCSLELNQPGSLEFQLVYGHPAFQNLTGMKTYVAVEKDGDEIFYGRVLAVEPSLVEGQESISCEGALSFLNDGHLAPDPRNSSGVYTHQTQTAEAFFNRVIDAYNADIGTDRRRNLTVGEVSHSRKNETKQYQITSFMSAKEALENQLLNQYGGFLRIRSDGEGGHLIDWVESYGRQVTGTIELGENVISQTNRISGEELFTAIRPVGKDGLVHSTTPVLNVYPPEDMAEYGVIIKNIDFPSISTESALLAAGSELVSKINKTLYISSEISVLDLHFIDDEEPDIRLGDTYTNIEGLSGVSLTISSHCMDFENPQNDSISLKNAKHLEGNGLDNFRNEGSASKRSARNSGGVSQALKYYHELEDELGSKVSIVAARVQIAAEKLLDIHADQFIQTGANLETLSTTVLATTSMVQEIQGTGVIQNSEAITTLAGQFEVVKNPSDSLWRVKLVEGSQLQVQKNGVYSEVVGSAEMSTAINQTASAIRYEFGRKSTVYYQWSQPSGTTERPLVEGDLWIKDRQIRTYSQMQSFKYSELSQYDIKELYGTVIYGYSDGAWHELSNEQRQNLALAEDEYNENEVSHIRGDVEALRSSYHQDKAHIITRVEDNKNLITSSITQMAGYIASEVEDVRAGYKSSITQTADQIRSEVNNYREGLLSSITQQADRISLVVEGTGSNAHIKPAEIVAAINAQTGQSTIRLSADMITLDGGNVTLGSIVSIEDEGVFMSSVDIDGLTVTHSLEIDESGATIIGSQGNTWDMDDMVVDASVSNNTLTLHTLGGELITFSKATSLNASWSGSVMTMKAQQLNGGSMTDVATRTIGFGGSFGDHDIDFSVDVGSITRKSATSIFVPVDVKQLQGGGATTNRYSDIKTCDISSLLTTGSYNTGGTKTPGSSYIGFSSVTFTIPNASEFTRNDANYSTSNSNNVGSISKSGLTANTYIHWTVGGKKFHIVVNA